MHRNDQIWVICPDDKGNPTVIRRRLATELGEYGTSRMSFPSREMAEALLSRPSACLKVRLARWKVEALIATFSEASLASLHGVALAMNRGKAVTISSPANR